MEEQVTMMVLLHRLPVARQCDARRASERYDVIRAPDHLPSHLGPDEVSLRVASALRDDGGRRARPASTTWISDDLLQRTRRVWSKAYRRPVAEDEAIEILMNTKRFAEVLLKVRTEVQP